MILLTVSVFNVVLVLICAGVVLYLINRYVPMDGKIKNILNWVIILIIVFWLLNIFGILNVLKNARI